MGPSPRSERCPPAALDCGALDSCFEDMGSENRPGKVLSRTVSGCCNCKSSTSTEARKSTETVETPKGDRLLMKAELLRLLRRQPASNASGPCANGRIASAVGVKNGQRIGSAR